MRELPHRGCRLFHQLLHLDDFMLETRVVASSLQFQGKQPDIDSQQSLGDFILKFEADRLACVLLRGDCLMSQLPQLLLQLVRFLQALVVRPPAFQEGSLPGLVPRNAPLQLAIGSRQFRRAPAQCLVEPLHICSCFIPLRTDSAGLARGFYLAGARLRSPLNIRQPVPSGYGVNSPEKTAGEGKSASGELMEQAGAIVSRRLRRFPETSTACGDWQAVSSQADERDHEPREASSHKMDVLTASGTMRTDSGKLPWVADDPTRLEQRTRSHRPPISSWPR